MWWLLLVSLLLDDAPASSPAVESTAPPPPPVDDELEQPPASDEVPVPDGCRWQIVADGRTAALCGQHQMWRAVVAGDDEKRRYDLPEQAITRIIHRLQLARSRAIELHGATFAATLRKVAGKWNWQLTTESDTVEGRAPTLLEAFGELWQRTGTP